MKCVHMTVVRVLSMVITFKLHFSEIFSGEHVMQYFSVLLKRLSKLRCLTTTGVKRDIYRFINKFTETPAWNNTEKFNV